MSGDSDRYGRAGDYVMGRMEPAERERAERDLERDPQFREAVLRLSERIRRSDAVSDRELWRAVEAGLSSLPQMRSAVLPTSSQAGRTRRRSDAARTRPQPEAGWKGALLLAGVAAACGASYVAGDIQARSVTPELVVTLADPQGGTGGILELGEDHLMRFVPLEIGAASDGAPLQLWTIYDEATGFVPLGALLPGGVTRWRGPDLPAPQAGQRYVVATGDSEASLPAGPFLFEGTARPVAGR